MNLQLVPAGKKKDKSTQKKKRMMPAKQLGGVESPATVLMHPITPFEDNISWWTYDRVLIGGIKVNGIQEFKGGTNSDLILYLPTPIPRSWAERSLRLVVEYEAEEQGSIFQFRAHYGCGDPSELHRGETQVMTGKSFSKRRMSFDLDEKYIQRNELFRATLEIVRMSPKPILVYGMWLEIDV